MQIQELEVARSLTLTERAVTLALAISLDNDYFSRHGSWYVVLVNTTFLHGSAGFHVTAPLAPLSLLFKFAIPGFVSAKE